MKRSDMSYALEGLLIALDAKMAPAQYPDKAAAILKFVEEAGMKPPKSSTIDLGLCNYPVYEWEIEDEKK